MSSCLLTHTSSTNSDLLSKLDLDPCHFWETEYSVLARPCQVALRGQSRFAVGWDKVTDFYTGVCHEGSVSGLWVGCRSLKAAGVSAVSAMPSSGSLENPSPAWSPSEGAADQGGSIVFWRAWLKNGGASL